MVFPAPAGINRYWNCHYTWNVGVPRASGDKPPVLTAEIKTLACSPRQRG
ncbi:hypothetical protein H8401_001461 [Salmonella enterica subsp. enterica serovar Soerenga]|nr:hypothetical protein [Salmonella enterica subsp. enterica serovar Soerenga]